MAKAIFLDKDGTLIPDIPYNVDPDLITIQPHSIEGLQRLAEEGYLFVVISNQAGVAHGYFTEEKLEAVEKKLKELLAPCFIQFLLLSASPPGHYGKVCNKLRLPKATARHAD
jgi:HAD superfamily hydrolase (TIGR01662 family)